MRSVVALAFILTMTIMVAHSQMDDGVMRKKMVEEQIVSRGVSDAQVLDAMRSVKRHLFVPDRFRSEAYDDHPLPIGHGQTISQPFIVAFMTEALQLKPDDKVLEIGTGSGYQAAVLAHIVDEVYTIEILKSLALQSRERFEEMKLNIQVKHGDGYQGWKEHAPFDKIIITAAPPNIPDELIQQLKVGGLMVVPIGTSAQELVLITRTPTGFEKEHLLPVRFVPMVNR